MSELGYAGTSTGEIETMLAETRTAMLMDKKSDTYTYTMAHKQREAIKFKVLRQVSEN